MPSQKFRIAIFASGSGTNAEEIFLRFKNHPAIEIGVLLSNNPQAFALERARKFNIESKIFTREEFKNPDFLLTALRDKNISYIVLAGFLWLIPEYLVNA